MKSEWLLAWVRTLPCYVCGSIPSEAHHRTGGGMGLKTSDDEAFPLCTRHHREFHDGNGHFCGWTKADRTEWQRHAVEAVRAMKDESCF